MIETDKNLISQWNLNQSAPNLQNRACFSKLVKMSPKSAMLQSKLTKISNFGHAKSAIKDFCQSSNSSFPGGTSNFGHAKSAIKFFCQISNFSYSPQGVPGSRSRDGVGQDILPHPQQSCLE